MRKGSGMGASVIPGLFQTKGEEKKVLFTSGTTSGSSTLALNATGTIEALNLIQVGSSMFNRIGRRIEMTSVRLEAYVNPINATRNCSVDLGRIMIVYDRQTNGAFPAITDVIQDTDQTGANTTTAQTGINMNNRDRFVSILDHRMYLPQGTTTAGVASLLQPADAEYFKPVINEFRKLRMLTTHYKADSNPAVIGDITTGGLFIFSLANNTAGSDMWQIANWNVRLKYVDM